METKPFNYHHCVKKCYVLLCHINTDLVAYGYNLARLNELKEFFDSCEEGEEYNLYPEVLWSLDGAGVKALTNFIKEICEVADSLENINNFSKEELHNAIEEEDGLEHRADLEAPENIDDYSAWVDQIHIYLYTSMESIFYRLSQLYFGTEEPGERYCYNSTWYEQGWEAEFDTTDQNVNALIRIIQKYLLMELPEEYR